MVTFATVAQGSSSQILEPRQVGKRFCTRILFEMTLELLLFGGIQLPMKRFGNQFRGRRTVPIEAAW